MLLERIGPDRYLLADDRLLDWIAPRVGADASAWRGMARALGVVIRGEVVAAMAVGAWERGNVEISFAADSPRWATRDTIRRLMAWPFRQLDCHRVTTRIAASNTRAIRFNEGIGFKREGVMRQASGPNGEDMIIFGMLRSEAPQWMLAATPEIA
jgi:RimJ/RimL family protein N-acetyltransferase